MKLQRLLFPILTLALMACGQLAPSKKNGYDTKSLFGATAGGCPALEIRNASGVEANLLTTYYACAGASGTSVTIKYNLMNAGYNMCVYPGSGTSLALQPQCFTPNSFTGETTLQFTAQQTWSTITSVAIVEQQNRSSFEQSLSFGGTITAPYAFVKFR